MNAVKRYILNCPKVGVYLYLELYNRLIYSENNIDMLMF